MFEKLRNPSQITLPSEPFPQGDRQFIYSMKVQDSPILKILNELLKYKGKVTIKGSNRIYPAIWLKENLPKIGL